jgi:hypothetical protein
MTITVYLRNRQSATGALSARIMADLLGDAEKRSRPARYGFRTDSGWFMFEAADVTRIEVDL